MSHSDFSSPREAARAFTPQLSAFVDDTLYPCIWNDLPAHLRRAVTNGVTREELAATITHLAFYAGFPAAISASVAAHATLGDDHTVNPSSKQEDLK
jgi:4-carboxymuconolactone decarboxylase